MGGVVQWTAQHRLTEELGCLASIWIDQAIADCWCGGSKAVMNNLLRRRANDAWALGAA
jgi:hypothetical protein